MNFFIKISDYLNRSLNYYGLGPGFKNNPFNIRFAISFMTHDLVKKLTF